MATPKPSVPGVSYLIEELRAAVEEHYAPGRARSLAATKLDELSLWLLLATPSSQEPGSD